MLAEKLMNIPTLQLIQINTDGLTVKYHRQYKELYNQICSEWEQLTKLSLEFNEYSKMMIRDVNSYIAVYTNGKTKCKGSFEFEKLPLHKNKSALVIRKAIYNWFIKGIKIEDTILNHDNVLDFCIGVKAKGETKFVALDKNANETNLSKTIRYFISKQGSVIKKRFNDGRIQFLNVHPLKGRTFRQTILNKFDEKLLKESIKNIDYSYYIHGANKELSEFNKLKLL